MLHARLSPNVAGEGLSPWSREFAKRVAVDPQLMERLSRPGRVEAVNGSFAGLPREAGAVRLQTDIFKPYRWIRLAWPAGSNPSVLADRLRASRLFDHVEPEPQLRDRPITWHQSATVTDPLYTATTSDPHRRQWAIDQARFKDAFTYTEGRALIGIPDTGINPDHPDLLAAQRPHQRAALVRYTLPSAESFEDMGGGLEQGFFPQTLQLNGDLGGLTSRYSSDVGHGLHVTGLVAATKNNSEGGVGGCPGCGVAVLRFVDPTLLPTALQALGLSFGATAINMSFALPYLSQLQMDTLSALDARDVSLIASIGNEARKRELTSIDAGRSAFPGYLPFVISVGGTLANGERWHERTVMTRPLDQRHPQLWWDAVVDDPGCPLRSSGLGLTPPNEQLLPVNSPRPECGSNWGREQRAAAFTFTFPQVPITVTLPPGQYGLDLMAPAAQVLAPLDRAYALYLTERAAGPNAVLRPFPCWLAPGPLCELSAPFGNTAPATNRIANAGVSMGADDVSVSFSQVPRNEFALGHENYGTITGTSMAAPLATAAVGLVRSANPLLRSQAVHDLLRCTATPMSNSEVWSGDPVLNPNPTINATIRTELTGSGRLNAEAAVRRTLGTVNGQTLRNRLIPMFSLTTWGSEPRQGWLFTTSPQVAMSGMTGDLHRLTDPALPVPNTELPFDPDGPGPFPTYAGNPLPSGSASPANDVGTAQSIAYASAIIAAVGGALPSSIYGFPGDWPKAATLAPSSSFYVLSTPFDPVAQTANGLLPLHRMSMKCDQYRHHYYTASVAERFQAAGGPTACSNSSSLAVQGWYDDGVEGYVHSPTAPQPAGTVALERGWLPSIANWVLMTTNERLLGKFPGVQQISTLGYVYPAVSYSANGTAQFLDSDVDGLPDAFETLIGLNSLKADSDGDGRSDGLELPFAAPGVSDPRVVDAVIPCVP